MILSTGCNKQRISCDAWCPDKDSIKFIRGSLTPSAVTRIMHGRLKTENIFVTTDEGGSNHAKLWDITNISSQVRACGSESLRRRINGCIMHTQTATLYLAHYRAGVIVYNIQNPANPVEVGHYMIHTPV